VLDERTRRAKKEIGKKLEGIRVKAGLSPGAIVKRAKLDGVKIDRSYIYDIESGEANWSIDKLTKILQYCHTSLESFFFGLQRSDIPPDHQPFHRMLEEILKSQDPDLTFGIRVNLEAISEKAARAHPPRPDNLGKALPASPASGSEVRGRASLQKRKQA
jgi:transcriptional regulator with XRE-family HTH domain